VLAPVSDFPREKRNAAAGEIFEPHLCRKHSNPMKAFQLLLLFHRLRRLSGVRSSPPSPLNCLKVYLTPMKQAINIFIFTFMGLILRAGWAHCSFNPERQFSAPRLCERPPVQ
jgi:hypothetical protein